MRGFEAALVLAMLVAIPFVPASAAEIVDVTFSAPQYVAAGSAAAMGGRVVGPLGQPAPGVRVTLLEDGDPIAVTTTQLSGQFTFSVTHGDRESHAYRAVALDAVDAVASASPTRTVQWAVPPSALAAPSGALWYDAQAFTFAWTAAHDDGGAPITGSRLYHGPSANGPWTMVAEGRSAQLDGFAWNAAHYLQARDRNIAGEGPVGAVLAFRTPAAVPPGPVAPPALTATDASITATWTPPAAPGNGLITSYTVEKRENGGPWSTVFTPTPFSASFSAPWGTTVDVRVRATSNAGAGAFGPHATVVVPDKHGLTLRTPRVEVCQSWPLHLQCWPVEDGATRDVYDATTTVLVFGEGELYEPVNTPAVGATVALSTTFDGQTVGHSATTGAGGHWSGGTEIAAVVGPAGTCTTWTGSMEGTAGAFTASDSVTFTLCSTGAPP